MSPTRDVDCAVLTTCTRCWLKRQQHATFQSTQHHAPSTRDSCQHSEKQFNTHHGLQLSPQSAPMSDLGTLYTALVHGIILLMSTSLSIPLTLLATLVRSRGRYPYYRSLFAYVMLQCCNCSFITAIPDPPRNLSISWMAARAATVEWTIAEYIQVEEIRIIIHPVSTENVPFVEVEETLDGDIKSHTFRDLYPETQYQVYARLKNFDDQWSNQSEVISFRTLEGGCWK